MGGLDEVVKDGAGFTCKEEMIALGSVIVTLATALVAVVKIGFNMLKDQLKAERDHSASLEVTFNSAKQKKAESPK